MNIRKMTAADLEQVCVIEEETFSDPWSREDFQNALLDEKNEYLVAEAGGRIAGYCGFWGVVGEGDIFNVAVKKEFRRQHIGERMLKELIGRGIARGITSFTLEVRSSNEAAIRLYETLGFTKSGLRRDFYSKPREDAVIMWLNTIQ
ncbi:ribosomal-protein-alanine N-acetyltransferase [Anaerotaenia torta]|uniref:ribosomal protein S18-alanine N-acetyltransferase n=1 Tax=Anaerotaenia torta TaxID=433293 RepID=UPI003D1C054A